MARKDNLNSNLFNDKLYTEGFRDELTPLDAQHMNKLVDGALLNEKSISDLKNDLSDINKELSNVKGEMLSYTDPNQSIGEQGAQLVRNKIDVPSKSEVSDAIQDAISKADISGGSAEGAVVYNDSQELTEGEQKTARQNIGINLTSDDNTTMPNDIPDVGFMQEYVYDAMKQYCITYTDVQVLDNSFKRQAAENIGAVTYVEGQELSDVDRLKARSNIKVVSYEAPIDEEFALTDEEKEQARKNIGAISQTELDQAIANADASGDFISYTETQELTDEQKELARENIGALAANAVVDSLLTSDNQFLPYNVPNGIAINDFATKYLIRCDVEQAKLTPEEKAQARANIGAGAAEIYVKTPEEKEAIPTCALYVDLTADAAATTSEITEESKNELPTCEAVKNYVGNTISTTDDGNGNITLNTSGKKVEFSDDGNGNIKMEVI